jgi:hypothetical protein
MLLDISAKKGASFIATVPGGVFLILQVRTPAKFPSRLTPPEASMVLTWWWLSLSQDATGELARDLKNLRSSSRKLLLPSCPVC